MRITLHAWARARRSFGSVAIEGHVSEDVYVADDTDEHAVRIGDGYGANLVVEHEIDEVLGLGSDLPSSTMFFQDPAPEDLFRYATTANVRSFSANASCVSPPQAFFSIDGTTHINEFHNCSDGADYGDWITHTPSQVQDAVTNGSGSPSLNLTSSETRALDVIGYTLAVRRRGQLVSE